MTEIHLIRFLKDNLRFKVNDSEFDGSSEQNGCSITLEIKEEPITRIYLWKHSNAGFAEIISGRDYYDDPDFQKGE